MALSSRVVYRCSSGHVFTVGWSPRENMGAGVINLGFGRFQRCPVGDHWALCKLAHDLTEEEQRAMEQREAGAEVGSEHLDAAAEDERVKSLFRQSPGQPPS
jgi:hypothetical protein